MDPDNNELLEPFRPRRRNHIAGSKSDKQDTSTPDFERFSLGKRQISTAIMNNWVSKSCSNMNSHEESNELLEPFRSRRRQISTMNRVSHTTSALDKLTLEDRHTPTSSFNASFPQSCRNVKSHKAENEVNDFQSALLKVIYDDRSFQKLKKEMRTKQRSGFASQQVVYKLIKDKKTNQRGNNNSGDLLGEETLRSYQEHVKGTKAGARRQFMAEIKKNLNYATEDFCSKIDLLRKHKSMPAPKKRIHTPRCA
mmetsp:Transcript_30040/g.45555  ORF Transcript_30040/g.45555 Transcript_30040/m.45555 type:complete len:253 (+) Transcript_30040:121-879(+)